MNRPSLHAAILPYRSSRLQDSFTLIELLVVVSIIGILSGLLWPALARSKGQAHGAICQNNTRQLMLACQMYCDDSMGYFPYNLANAAAETNINWAAGVLDWETTPDNTNTALLTSSALGPYMAQSSAGYRCPSDRVLSSIQQGTGWTCRARSYSINASIGDAGAITRGGVNTNNPSYVQFFKTSSVPAAARIFVFMEEHPDTIADGYFINKAYPKRWSRLPASYHDGCANISFADGHAELHRWQDSMTMAPSVPDGASGLLFTNLPAGQQDDFAWVIAHMTVRTN